MERRYAAIDLKSFYASVECVERGLDPLKTNLLVADPTRTEKTICLAVSPPLKALGVPGRPRLFEAIDAVKQINAARLLRAPGRRFTGESCDAPTLEGDPSLSLAFLTAPPRMALYIEYSSRIYGIYLRHVCPDDIHVYSIDEVFIDLTAYLRTGHTTPEEMTRMLIREVYDETGITATAGIGTNLFLAKVAMDVVAKKMPPDEHGVRIAELDEARFRETLWDHRPITDIWRIGSGTARRLGEYGLYTLGDIARCSLGKPYQIHNEKLLYKLFGVNAGLLIDHAWGWEPCTIADIKAYRPRARSLGMGQVLKRPYTASQARLVVREMAGALALDLLEKELVCDQVVLQIGYDVQNLADPDVLAAYDGDVVSDYCGRPVPEHSHGSESLGGYTDSVSGITDAFLRLFDRIARRSLLIRRLNLTAVNVLREGTEPSPPEQLDFFTDFEEEERRKQREKAALEKERSLQRAVLKLRRRYGKNAVFRGMNLLGDATMLERNGQIGGHKA